MKLKQLHEASELWPNKFFRVVQPIEIWKLGESKPTNHYYGRSQLYQRDKQKTRLGPSDEIHYLHGGTFAVRPDESRPEESPVFPIVILPPNDKSPFEKNYGPSSFEMAARRFAELVNQGVLEEIPKEQAAKVKYSH